MVMNDENGFHRKGYKRGYRADGKAYQSDTFTGSVNLGPWLDLDARYEPVEMCSSCSVDCPFKKSGEGVEGCDEWEEEKCK